MSGRGNRKRGGGILRLGGPSGQGTEGYPKIGGTMREQRLILWVGDVGPLNIRKIFVPRAKGERAKLPPKLRKGGDVGAQPNYILILIFPGRFVRGDLELKH